MADEEDAKPPVEEWTGRSGFVLATIGSAVGIGSVWKFPYEVGSNGGGSFVLVYGVGLVAVVVPLMMAEFAIGRRGRGDAMTSLLVVATAEARSPLWKLGGIFGALAAFLILSFYAVIGGWTLAYAGDALLNGMSGDAAVVTDRFDDLLASSGRQVFAQLLFLAVVMAVVLRGVQRGIESAMKVLMPLLFVLLIALAIYSSIEGDLGEAVRFLFVPKAITGTAILDAVGLGFFSIGVGLGLMITYAAFSPPNVRLKEVAVISVLADSAVSIIAGFAVFPIVFAHGLDPAGGPGLVFVTMPVALSSVPGARFVAVGFFLLLFVAALGSAVAMLEGFTVVLTALTGWSRRRSVVGGAIACSVIGLATVLSFNHWADWHPLGFIRRFADDTVYDLIDFLTSNVMLPAGGLVLAILTGWVLSPRLLGDELDMGGRELGLLRGVLRFVVPIAIVAATVATIVG